MKAKAISIDIRPVALIVAVMGMLLMAALVPVQRVQAQEVEQTATVDYLNDLVTYLYVQLGALETLGYNLTAMTVLSSVESDEQTGMYTGYLDGELFIRSKDITRADALEHCLFIADFNPESTVRCTWKGEVIYDTEAQDEDGGDDTNDEDEDDEPTTDASAVITTISKNDQPTIVGRAMGTDSVQLSVTNEDDAEMYTSEDITVKNERWRHRLSEALTEGSYTATVFDGENVLAEKDFTVGGKGKGLSALTPDASTMSALILTALERVQDELELLNSE